MPLALIIPADLDADIFYENLNGLEDYQRIVGGYIETVPYRENVVPYFDEEGKIKGKPVNERATALLRNSIFPGDYIAGTCLFVGFDPETGEEKDLPDGTLTA